jgi:hypothetical protein
MHKQHTNWPKIASAVRYRHRQFRFADSALLPVARLLRGKPFTHRKMSDGQMMVIKVDVFGISINFGGDDLNPYKIPASRL